MPKYEIIYTYQVTGSIQFESDETDPHRVAFAFTADVDPPSLLANVHAESIDVDSIDRLDEEEV